MCSMEQGNQEITDKRNTCYWWSVQDGNKIVSGGADKAARMFDVTTGQAVQVAQHNEPIKCVKFLDQPQPILATGSWDKTIKYWDLRSPQPIGTVQLPERCYTMDTVGQLMVVGCAEKSVCIFDLNNPTTIFKVCLEIVVFGEGVADSYLLPL